MNKDNVRLFFNRHRPKIIVTLLIFAVILIPVIVFFVLTKDTEEPYFIIIDENSDFEIWATNGTGTIEDPYIIEGHTIHIPQDYPSYISGIIRISDVTKHFIIQNNRLSANIHDINAHIYIYRVNSSFIIRNNTLSGWSRISPADSIHLRYCYIEGKGLIYNNTFNDSNLHFYQVKHIDIFNNTFFSETEYSVWHGSNYAWQSSHIFFSGNNFVNTAIRTQDVSNLTVQSNIFNHTLHEFHSSISSHYSTNTRYVNNTFINTGLSMGDSDYLSAHIEGNVVNGKPLGVFINQTNMIIDNSTQYGQIKVLSCSHSMISGQMIDNTSISLSIMYCMNTTIFNCSFSNFRTGVYVGSSNATEIIENEFISPIYQDYAIDADYANGLYLKRNIFGEFYTTLLLWYCTDVVEEDNIYL